MRKSWWLDIGIVVIIIGVLGAIVVTQLNWQNEQMVHRNTKRLADLYSLESSINLALQNLPATATPFPKSIKTDSCHQSTAVDGTGWVQFDPTLLPLSRSIKQLPTDPLQPQRCYVFKTGPDGKTFKIEAQLEVDRDGSAYREMANDGGANDYLLELGNDRAL